MTLTRLNVAIPIVPMAALILGGASVASAQTNFRDDFNDGSIFDNAPVTWTTLCLGVCTFEASSGDLVMALQGGGVAAAQAPVQYAQGASVRTRVRLIGPAGNRRAAVALGNFSGGTGHVVQIEKIDTQFVVILCRADGGSLTQLDEAPLGFDPSDQDVLLQVDTFEGNLSGWAWLPGSPMPASPQVSAFDPDPPKVGYPNLFCADDKGEGSQSSCAFRFVQASSAPLTHSGIGDITSNGVVDVIDLLAVITAWGPCPPPPAACPADIAPNGVVDVNDLLLVLTNWN